MGSLAFSFYKRPLRRKLMVFKSSPSSIAMRPTTDSILCLLKTSIQNCVRLTAFREIFSSRNAEVDVAPSYLCFWNRKTERDFLAHSKRRRVPWHAFKKKYTYSTVLLRWSFVEETPKKLVKLSIASFSECFLMPRALFLFVILCIVFVSFYIMTKTKLSRLVAFLFKSFSAWF